MAQYHVYVDESGKLHQQTDYTCLCGYLADGETWEHFSAQWNRVRMRWNVPPVHMAKVMKKDGPNLSYKHDVWDAVRSSWGSRWIDTRNEMLEEFASVISSLAIVALGAVVDAAAYRRLRREESPAVEADPNVFAFQQIIMEGLRRIESVAPHSTLSIIVDDDSEHAFGYYQLAQSLRNHPEKETFLRVREKLHGLCFGSDNAYPGLQAADMLAWVSRRHMIDQRADAEHLPTKLLRLLTFGGLNQPVVYDDAALRAISIGTIAALQPDK